MIQSYLMQKETDQKNVELQLKSEHTMKVLQMYNQENEKSRKIIELSHDILHEAYLVMSGNMLITDSMREKFNQLYKIHDQRGVKFTESDEVFEIADQPIQIDYLFDTDHMMARDDDETGVHSNKRTRDQYGDDTDMIPTKKRVVRSIFDGQNLDKTHTLNLDDGSMNATFAIKPKVNTKCAAPDRALKESNPNVHKGFMVPKPITKSITKVKSTMGVQREKENKRTPQKIRRSPRAIDTLSRSEYLKSNKYCSFIFRQNPNKKKSFSSIFRCHPTENQFHPIKRHFGEARKR